MTLASRSGRGTTTTLRRGTSVDTLTGAAKGNSFIGSSWSKFLVARFDPTRLFTTRMESRATTAEPILSCGFHGNRRAVASPILLPSPGKSCSGTADEFIGRQLIEAIGWTESAEAK